jgi:hypothetical protein
MTTVCRAILPRLQVHEKAEWTSAALVARIAYYCNELTKASMTNKTLNLNSSRAIEHGIVDVNGNSVR